MEKSGCVDEVCNGAGPAGRAEKAMIWKRNTDLRVESKEAEGRRQKGAQVDS